MGLARGGITSIYAHCLKFGLTCLYASRLGARGRRERQQARKRLRERQRHAPPPPPDPPTTKEKHHLFCSPPDLTKSSWGIFDKYLPRCPTAEGGEEEERCLDQLQARVFHLLCVLFNSSTPVRGFHQVLQSNLAPAAQWMSLQGRPQRRLADQEAKRLLLRPILEGSKWEELLLRAAHHFAPSHLHRAEVGLFNLHIYINRQTEKLRMLDKTCSSCCITRARQNCRDDRVRLTDPGPCNYLHRAAAWQRGDKTLICDLAGSFQCCAA